MLGMDLVHGWVVDKEDTKLHKMLHDLSYNQTADLLININSKIEGLQKKQKNKPPQEKLETKAPGKVIEVPTEEANGINGVAKEEIPQPSANGSRPGPEKTIEVSPDLLHVKDSSSKGAPSSDGTGVIIVEALPMDSESPEEDAKDAEEEALSSEELETLKEKQRMLMQFLKTSSHQLTYYGLSSLHEKLVEGHLCVFFRNNHFAVLHKHNKELYLLVTDIAFTSLPNVVWEKLSTVDGDTLFTNSDFYILHNPQANTAAAVSVIQPTDKSSDTKGDMKKNTGVTDEELAQEVAKRISNEQEERDAQLAKQLYQQDVSQYGAPSRAHVTPVPPPVPPAVKAALSDEEYARQLQAQEMGGAQPQSGQVARQMSDEEYARRLQDQENGAAQQRGRRTTRTGNTRSRARGGRGGQARGREPGSKKKCSIM